MTGENIQYFIGIIGAVFESSGPFYMMGSLRQWIWDMTAVKTL